MDYSSVRSFTYKSYPQSHPVFTFSFWAYFHPYTLSQWYPQSKEIWLNFSMKCLHSTFDAQGLRLTILVVQVGAVKALRKKESLPPNWVEKVVWVPVISFCKYVDHSTFSGSVMHNYFVFKIHFGTLIYGILAII
jgi:hypothetical protein